MARPLRLEFPGALYHVTARGNRRETIFRNDEDRRAMREPAIGDSYGLSTPWAKLTGQIFLGGEEFLKRMEEKASGQPTANVPAGASG